MESPCQLIRHGVSFDIDIDGDGVLLCEELG